MLDDAEDRQSINSMASSFQRFTNIFTLYKFISSIFIEFKGNNLIEESTDKLYKTFNRRILDN